MPTKNEAIQFDGKGASYVSFVNTAVDLIADSTDGKQVDNMVAMVNQVNLDADIIKGFCNDFASGLLAKGIDKDSVKALKSAHKCILDFALGVRKKQQDKPELWSNGEGRQLIVEEFKGASSINNLAKECRKAESDEEEEKPWVLEEEVGKLLERAHKEGYTLAEFTEVIKKLTEIDQAA